MVVVLCLCSGAAAVDTWNALSLSDSVLSFGVVTTGGTHSLGLTVINNLTVPVMVTSAGFEESVFTADISNPGDPVPALGTKNVTIYFDSDQNVNYTDFLRIELDQGIRSLIAEVSAEAHHADTYYDCSQNKWGEELKDSLTALIDGHNSLGYTLARDNMYSHIDNDDGCTECPTTGCVECVYTGRIGCFNTRAGATANNFNCEHTWPQSFSGEAEPMKSDIFHLYPTDMTANNYRANLDFGVVVSATWSQGGSKLGTDSEGQTVFEPRDVHKGNVARSHFYYIIRYDGNYNGYQDASKMESHFRNWHVSDPIDGAEQQRNEDIYDVQLNRNPFIDHPEFADRISSFFGTATIEIGPEIAVTPMAIGMGAIGFGSTAHHYIAITNTGNDTLNVTSITSTDPDFDVGTASLYLLPETYEYVRIAYTSDSTDISDSTSIVIVSDDGDESTVEVPVTVQVLETAGIVGGDAVPSSISLYQNYPNPFGSETTIDFELDRSAAIDLAVYNVQGQIVRQVLGRESMPPGRHGVSFSAWGLPSGVYYYRLTAGEAVQARRMLLLQGLR
jgi:endonuclease I